MIDGINDVLRVANIAACLGGLILVAGSLWLQRARLTRDQIMLRLAIGALLLATCWSSIEVLIAQQTAPGIRPWILVVAIAWTIAAFAFEARDRRPRHRGK